MFLETLRLTWLPCSPEHLLALIDHPERLETLLGLRGADDLRPFHVSDEVSPDWLAALWNSHGPDVWRHGFFRGDRETCWVLGSSAGVAAGTRARPNRVTVR